MWANDGPSNDGSIQAFQADSLLILTLFKLNTHIFSPRPQTSLILKEILSSEKIYFHLTLKYNYPFEMKILLLPGKKGLGASGKRNTFIFQGRYRTRKNNRAQFMPSPPRNPPFRLIFAAFFPWSLKEDEFKDTPFWLAEGWHRWGCKQGRFLQDKNFWTDISELANTWRVSKRDHGQGVGTEDRLKRDLGWCNEA